MKKMEKFRHLKELLIANSRLNLEFYNTLLRIQGDSEVISGIFYGG